MLQTLWRHPGSGTALVRLGEWTLRSGRERGIRICVRHSRFRAPSSGCFRRRLAYPSERPPIEPGGGHLLAGHYWCGFGQCQGRWWLKGAGLVGVEGNGTPLATVAPAITAMAQRQAQSAAANSDHSWSSRLASGDSSGGTEFIDLGGGQFANWDH
jgi:hypothetical protein